jgi:hypothetical protein
MFSKASRSISRVSGYGFTELHAWIYADTFLEFAIHRRQNGEQNGERNGWSIRVKAMPVHSAVTWQINSIRLRNHITGLRSHLLTPRHLNNKSSETIRWTLCRRLYASQNLSKRCYRVRSPFYRELNSSPLVVQPVS